MTRALISRVSSPGVARSVAQTLHQEQPASAQREASFRGFFAQATGGWSPYRWQTLVALDGLPDVLSVPTGLGNVRTAVCETSGRQGLGEPRLQRKAEFPGQLADHATPLDRDSASKRSGSASAIRRPIDRATHGRTNSGEAPT